MAFVCSALAAVVGLPALARAATQPNFIIIVADDMGYGDLSSYGSKVQKTPNIDRLAADGLRFESFYSNGAVCSPTRAALMTGCYQQRVGITGVVAAKTKRDKGLDPSVSTIGRMLKDAGYATGIMGKWHLGYDGAFNPRRHGFDVFRGFVSGNVDYQSHIDQANFADWWHDDALQTEAGYTTHLITKHSIDFIRENQQRPFFLYVPHAAPHYPYQGPNDPPERTLKSPTRTQGSRADRRAAYSEMIAELDKSVGEVIAELRRLKLDDHTYVFFMSDNGPASPGSSGPLRGKKGSLFEGGVRVPGIVWCPGHVAVQVTQTAAMTMDLAPTMLDLAGIPPPKGVTFDGVSLRSLLEDAKALERRTLFWGHVDLAGKNASFAVRDGDWKLVVTTKGPAALFNLADDLAEQNDLAAQHPQKLRKMTQALRQWKKYVGQ